MFEMLTWRQLGLGDKPCAFLDVDGFHEPLVAMLDRMVEEGFLREQHRRDLWHGEDISRMLQWMRGYQPVALDDALRGRSPRICGDHSGSLRCIPDPRRCGAAGRRQGIAAASNASRWTTWPRRDRDQVRVFLGGTNKDALAGTGQGRILRR